MNRSRAKQLNLEYVFDGTVLHFEDGVDYSLDEALAIAQHCASAETVRAVHLIKKHFDGELIGVKQVSRVRRKVKFMDFKDWKKHACKCGMNKFAIVPESLHIGVYCKDCGRWQGWLKKVMVNRLLAMCRNFELSELPKEEKGGTTVSTDSSGKVSCTGAPCAEQMSLFTKEDK